MRFIWFFFDADSEPGEADIGLYNFNADLFDLPEQPTVDTNKTATTVKKSKLSAKKDIADNDNEDVGICMRTYRKNVMAWFNDKEPEEPLVNYFTIKLDTLS